MAELGDYVTLITTSNSIPDINKIRDAAMVDKDLDKKEFVALIKVVATRKNEVNNQ